ncbi:glycine--tRNA ligase [Candidatus Phytoplasma pini]|uniref:glycine--tRNA ligase n=1 Tax=Candidatus Phytoplasma pini TaxID=267362 RepID=A0A559KJ59_9MOLU|nr:glycine--tRNA ligase [Candidatus Phytoplasma pini]TVY12175.1 Glycyl-tRNA synthetase, class II [Candidatus Phytoplasma pini]
MKKVKNHSLSLKEIINFSKITGFVFPGSEIYGGLSNSFDYGPLGFLLKQNIKKAWIQKFFQEYENNVLIDSSIILNSQVWKASGHLSSFIDLLVENKDTNKRYRVDELINQHDPKLKIHDWDFQQMTEYLIKNKILGTRNWSKVREFNLLFQTQQGIVFENSRPLYLRPETCQGIFINFKNIVSSTRKKIPFGIGQIGKSFRNEITPGNFIFRTREFEQMELEFFCKPETHQKWFDFWKKYVYNFLLQLGLHEENLKWEEHEKKDLSHYSEATSDILFNFPWGFSELWGIASRTDFDLKNHHQHSQKDLQYFDAKQNRKYWPFVIEPSVGVERLFLALISDNLKIEKLDDNSNRFILSLHPFLSPYKLAILPLNKKEHRLKAKELQRKLSPFLEIEYDESQSIGKRYRRQDMIGTPFCCTIDHQTFEDDTVTIRNRDTLKQNRILSNDILNFIQKKILF